MSVRICFGITQLGGNPILQFFGDEMLQTLGLFMDFVPLIIENVVQEAFEQAVVANHFQSASSAGWRKTHAMVLFITHEGGALAGELLQHSGYGSGAYPEPFRKRVARYAAVFSAAELKNGLEIVVDGFAVFESSLFWSH